MFFYTADLGKEAAQVAVRSGLTVLESSILGAITLVSICLTVWSIVKLSKVQDLRVKDLERSNDRMELLVTKLTTTLSELSASIDKSVEETRRNERALDDLKVSVDGVVRDALTTLRAFGRSPTPRDIVHYEKGRGER